MDLSIPAYYIVNRKLDEAQVPSLLAALRITPVFCSIVSDLADAHFALNLCNDVIRVRNEADACTLAREIWSDTQRSPVVVGVADVLDAVFADGHKEQVAIAQC